VAEFKVILNPLVNWIWLGVGVMIIGTFIALLPERTFSFATSKVPEGAATTTVLVLALVLGSASITRAQHNESSLAVVKAPESPLEKDLRGAIICMCGDCGRKRVGECLCPVAAAERDEIATLVKAGKTRDEVIQYFVAKYGSQEPLAEPIDKGFNRLAWFFPYAAGIVGIAVVGGVAIRWSRRARKTDAPQPLQVVASPALQQQLDDELRDLD
jgi:cytochrome c-type biogenesis protein CcmH/NrfF